MNYQLLGGDIGGFATLAGEIADRGLKIAVIGIPKTIDNDISCIDRSFGSETAVSEATNAIYAAHVEAEGAKKQHRSGKTHGPGGFLEFCRSLSRFGEVL